MDGQTRATADLVPNTAIIHDRTGDEHLLAPRSESIFVVVERKLGLPPVTEFRTAGRGLASANERDRVEQNLPLATTPWAEARSRAADARAVLDVIATRSTMSPSDGDARQAIDAAMLALDEEKAGSNREARRHLEVARDRLRHAPETSLLAPLRGTVYVLCGQALASLDQDIGRNAGAEIAVAQPGQDSPAEPAIGAGEHASPVAGGLLGPEADIPAEYPDLFRPSRASRASERERDDARGIDAEDTGREM